MTRARVLLTRSLLFVCPLAIAQRPPIPQQLSFTPYHANGIYKIGETVGWTVMPGPESPTYAYKWTIRRNNAVVLKEGKLDLSSGKDKIEIAGDQPEMIYVAIEPYAALAVAPNAPNASATGAGQSGSAPQAQTVRHRMLHPQRRRQQPLPSPVPQLRTPAARPSPLTGSAATPAGTTDFTQLAPRWRRLRFRSQLRARQTSMHSGTASWLCRPRFPSTQC